MSGPDPHWQVYPPPAGGQGDGRWASPVPAWLAEVRRFRAEVLHADGLRPAFRGLDGAYHDEDPADLLAHHVVATLDGVPIASLRVVPLGLSRNGVCERLLGTTVLEKLLSDLGVCREEVGEGSGWSVEPSRRGARMGARVLAAGFAVARELGLAVTIGATGTRYGQLYRILSAGYRRAQGVNPIFVASLADDVQLVHGRLHELRPGFQALVEKAADLLRWETDSPTRVNKMPS